MKRNDIFLLSGILFAALLIFGIYFLIWSKSGDYVQITVNGTVTKTLPLGKNTTYTIRIDKASENVLQIKDGSASILKANCPDKLCVHQKRISKQGETLVCLPHKVVVSILSSDKENKKATLDGVAQ